MAQYQHVTQPFAPVWDNQSQILILGSFPSVKSREQGFYYGHPKNRFWHMLSVILGEDLPCSIEEKKAMLLKRHIALYDVIESCDIIGSSDSSIRNAVPADLTALIEQSEIQMVLANGRLAGKLYRQYHAGNIALPMEELPSTSPANAAFSLERLVEIWSAAIGKIL